MPTYAYSSERPDAIDADLLIVPVFQGDDGPEPGPGAKETGTASLFGDARLSGKHGESLLVPRRAGDEHAARAVLLLGVGGKRDLDVADLRRLLGRAAQGAGRFPRVATTLPLALGARDAASAVRAAAEGFGLGSYRFNRYRTGNENGAEPSEVTVVGSPRWDARAMRRAVGRAEVLVDAACWARDLVNTPAGDMPPAEIAKAAQKMAKDAGLSCKVWTEAQLEKGGFGGILGVGKGSANPPRLIELEYRGGRASRPPIALTGKGISFDSGGLSLKDAKGMEWMKSDMGGAASILATFKALAALKPKVNVIAAIPCAENLPSGTAQKPGDVIRHYGGTTSEVLNTDAEGRLVLADALAFLAEREPEVIVDTATLTGACMVALGTDIVGAMGNDDALVRELVTAGEAAGEAVWQLPLYGGYRKLIDSPVADIKNIGDRYGGAITAAWFLAEFVGDVPWCHLDIAGPARSERGNDLGPAGATGVPVRTLVEFVERRAAGRTRR